MEWVLDYLNKNYKYSIDIQKLIEELSEAGFTLLDYPAGIRCPSPR